MPQVFISAAKVNITLAGNTIYTVPAATKTTVIGLSIANKTPNVITGNVWITRSAVNYMLAANTTIYPGSAFVPIGADQKVVLIAADTISVSTSNTLAADVLLSALEIS